MKFNIYKISAIVCVLFLVLQMSPFVVWITGPPLLTIPSYCLVVFCFLILLLRQKLLFTPNRVKLSILVLLLAAHITLPIFTGITDLGRFFPFLILSLLFLFPDKVIFQAFLYFRKFHLFIAFFSILFFFIGLVIDIPHFTISGVTNILKGTDYYYKVYGFIVSSTNTVYKIGGFNIARICGIYQEPGHFATYLAIIIFIEKLIFKKISRLFIVTGVLTFSPVFYIALLLIFLHSFILERSAKQIKWYIIAALGFLFVASLFADEFKEKIWELAIGRNIADGSVLDALNQRTGGYTLRKYERFSETPSVWSGKGVEYVSRLGIFSDFRGYIFKYGIIGFTFSILLLMALIVHRKAQSFMFLMIPFAVLIYLQRSWMLGSTYIYLLFFISYVCYKNYKTLLNNTKDNKYA